MRRWRSAGLSFPFLSNLSLSEGGMGPGGFLPLDEAEDLLLLLLVWLLLLLLLPPEPEEDLYGGGLELLDCPPSVLPFLCAGCALSEAGRSLRLRSR